MGWFSRKNVKKIDPTNLSDDESQMLHEFFEQEELKDKGEKSKRKVYFTTTDCQFPQGYLGSANNQVFRFTKPLSRIKIQHKAVVILGPNDPMPEIATPDNKNILYFKKNPADNTIQFRSFNEIDNNLKDLTPPQLAKLDARFKKQLDTQETIEIKNDELNHKLVSSIVTTTRKYYDEYIYRIIDDKKPIVGKGAMGVMYESPGILKHYSSRSGRTMQFVRDLVPMVAKFQKTDPTADAKKRARIDEQRRNENILWQRDPDSLTSKSTRVKKYFDGSPVITHEVMFQKKFKGKNLEKILKRNRLTVAQRYELTQKLLEELEKLHLEQGTHHRDIKPANIMVDLETMQVKIIDLGLAIDAKKNDNSFCGTPGYISPEMWCDGRQVNTQNDIYSMGIVLRELWDDKVSHKKLNTLRSYKEKGQYALAEYAMNISMKDAELPSHITKKLNKLDPKKAEQITTLLNGMTASKPNERLSLEDTKKILANETITPKHHEEKEIQPLVAKIMKDIKELNPRTQLLLLSEAAQKLEKYCASKQDLSTNLRNLLNEYNTLIKITLQKDFSADPSEKIETVELIRQTDDIFWLLKKEPDSQKTLDTIFENLAAVREMTGISNLNSAKKELASLTPKENNTWFDFAKKAWNDTFKPNMTRKQRENTGFAEYFLGWPAKQSAGVQFAYGLTFLWALNFVKNAAIKAPLEFSFKLFSESAQYGKRKLSQAYPESGFGKKLQDMGMNTLSALHAAAETPRLLFRSIISPVTSAKASEKQIIKPLARTIKKKIHKRKSAPVDDTTGSLAHIAKLIAVNGNISPQAFVNAAHSSVAENLSVAASAQVSASEAQSINKSATTTHENNQTEDEPEPEQVSTSFKIN